MSSALSSRLGATTLSSQDSDVRGAQFLDAASVKQRETNSEAMATLKRLYKAKIRPLEHAFKFAEFYDSELTDGDFDAKPFVLLIGQYSVGKTSFIQYLLERSDVPGSRVGPEPTTDRFLAVMAGRPGQTDTIVPGNAAAVDVARPFTSLSKFGVSFLSRFEVAELSSSPILDSISFVDTPGILAGEKQTLDRGYSYEDVIEWFAARADRILILFDAHKLDISDELKRVIETLKGHDDKIRIVLNKADMVSAQQLMRVYGALMWSLGKVIRSPEVLRVYIGSFWDQPTNEVGKENEPLYSAEEADLLDDLRNLPRNAAVRRVNELVKRARLAKVHALLVTHLRNNMPYLWGHKKKQDRLATKLEDEYTRVQKAHGLAAGDFPAPERFRAGLNAFDLSEFPAMSKRMLDVADGALSRDIPALLLALGDSTEEQVAAENYDMSGKVSRNPFDVPQTGLEGAHAEETFDTPDAEEPPWAIGPSSKKKWDEIFHSLDPTGTPLCVSGASVRGVMLESGLPPRVLKKVWDLADIDEDGMLDAEEFAVAMQLIKIGRTDGANAIPDQLSRAFVPPSKR